MNWSKAKSILIIAFLITNAVLAMVLFSEGKQEISTVKDSFIEDVIGILGKKEILVATEIPSEIPSLNTLTVKYEILDHLDINKRFFDGRGSVEIPNEDRAIIRRDHETISIENGKKLVYMNNRQGKAGSVLDLDAAKAMVESFLTERGYDTSGMTLWRTQEGTNGEYMMEYSMMYNERFLETTYTRVILDNEGILELERLWLTPISQGETPIYISTAPKALLDLIGNEEVYGKTIEDISLCYYFDPKKDQYIEEPEETKEGKSIPAWRVTFEDGSKIIIDNY